MFFKCDMIFICTISNQGKVRDMTMTTVGHGRRSIACLDTVFDNNSIFR
jgi:hypothetical protein